MVDFDEQRRVGSRTGADMAAPMQRAESGQTVLPGDCLQGRFVIEGVEQSVRRAGAHEELGTRINSLLDLVPREDGADSER